MASSMRVADSGQFRSSFAIMSRSAVPALRMEEETSNFWFWSGILNRVRMLARPCSTLIARKRATRLRGSRAWPLAPIASRAGNLGLKSSAPISEKNPGEQHGGVLRIGTEQSLRYALDHARSTRRSDRRPDAADRWVNVAVR